MKKTTLLFVFASLCAVMFSQYFDKSDTVKIYRSGTDITIDGKSLEKCWDSTEWMPIEYIWAQNPSNGTESYLSGVTDIRTSTLGLDTTDFKGRFKMLWSSKTNLLYILAEITDNALVSNYDWVGNKGNYTGFDDIEIFYQENGPCRQVWPGCDHTFTHKAKAIHLTSNGYGVDMGGPSWGSYVLYNRTMKSVINKAAPKYTWEIGMQLINEKVIDSQLQVTTDYTVSPLPDSLISKLAKDKVIGFTMNYIDVDIAGNKREHFISNLYVPDGIDGSSNRLRNASWQNSDAYGIAQLLSYSKTSYAQPQDTTDTTHTGRIVKALDDVLVYPNPVKENLQIVMNNVSSSKVSVKVISILGAVAAELEVDKPAGIVKEEINLAGVPAGVYLVEIVSNGQRAVKRITKQ